MKVKITGCKSPKLWYSVAIGMTVDVEAYNDNSAVYYIPLNGKDCNQFIWKSDCVAVTEGVDVEMNGEYCSSCIDATMSISASPCFECARVNTENNVRFSRYRPESVLFVTLATSEDMPNR
jgi:hypothetical protein